jgi:hypothetical protein
MKHGRERSRTASCDDVAGWYVFMGNVRFIRRFGHLSQSTNSPTVPTCEHLPASYDVANRRSGAAK